ncbi:anti-sigma factor RsiW [Mesorhizobium soli]|nr:anti-sigma factor RsiW [Mesorhizobium soli]
MRNDDMKITWETLNAYVDGELSPDAAAAVAAAIAADKAMAARVATLTRLRAVSRRLAAPAKAEQRRHRPGWKPVALTASLAAVLVAGGLSWSLRPTPGSEVNAAIAANETWLAADLHPDADGVMKAAAATSVAGALPDLSAAGLQLVYLSSQPFDAGEAIFAGYQGPHGCHLGLWKARSGSETALSALAPSKQAGLSVRQWATDNARYVLVGHGMDAQRFDRMADLVEQLIQQGHDATPEQRIALEEASRIGAPCQS